MEHATNTAHYNICHGEGRVVLQVLEAELDRIHLPQPDEREGGVERDRGIEAAGKIAYMHRNGTIQDNSPLPLKLKLSLTNAFGRKPAILICAAPTI